ncbi:kinase binding protein CGI-121, putative [Trypanosoma equiperdum]|uniref:Kinase binding protein CGI-121 n=4 Tax=Trypanozoon TaxID=39700 RepID=Q57YP7_TRYB2|nr:hypothetical protein, conserved [Trypanosoma brucei gambiense DAL972]XP_847476.1 hypothetical protein, conserved [Trypanosoma brucei brucei TREU927]AAX69273.1 hypothetical protein, conserved [Trypanosoma brucei]RHW73098.1 kinase binding protein CGI-121 [Trypanosoma brucei equiperdum]SCU70944.1 kinase binding protein CGI-121, putative [Trypanosoma equiperdum]AAZ13410.1 hypothetical protein, conserved [Trypanosoma brucei brucei TREU927]CBH13716.1 hypothetical protein, conserved [Trypanosoma |eukprot:XP_011775992.1 hypothetical protein, conserved [Trypanosoma brucei gambiense DAL972]
MERIGEFTVMAFHNVRNAAALHDHFKKKKIDAAVIDAAYIVSHLHLSVALHRLSTEPLITESGAKSVASSSTACGTSLVPERKVTARDVFSSLSHTRNLDRVLERLTCASTTTAVVIVLHAPSSQHVEGVAAFVEGEPHRLSDNNRYCKEAAVRDFYGVGEAETGLEAAVVNRLATSGI